MLQTNIVDARVTFHVQPLLRPLVLSSGSITQLTEAQVQVTVQVGSREAVGRGSIYLSDLWAWPSPTLSHEFRDGALHDLCQRIAEDLWDLCGREAAHPLELGLRLHDQVLQHQMNRIPILAQAMCLSPFDAALHDGVGQALERSAFSFYGEETPIPSADRFFPGQGAVAAVAALLRKEPLHALPAWYVVGKHDDLESEVKPWVMSRGYRCLKIKILGQDNVEDVARTVQVYRAAKRWGIGFPRLSVDANEANPDAQSVLDYLQQLKETDQGAYAALEYLEQPTRRDIVKARHDWRAVGALKPVMLDEGLTSLELLEEAREQSWSGLALKTCKGHSFVLVAAAWAHQHGMLLSLQDLTNPGYSAIHAALMAAFVPTINGVELNSPQFTPAANAPWLPPQGRLAQLLAPMDGMHRLPEIPVGLGASLCNEEITT